MRVVLLIFLLSPVMAAAQTMVTVRAGEHDGFTRVTFSLSEPTPWRQDGDGLVFSGDVLFDLNQAFTRIGRDRLGDLAVAGNRVAMSLGCACSVTSFQASERLIAADIRPAPAPIKDDTATGPAKPISGGATDLRQLLLKPYLDELKPEPKPAIERAEIQEDDTNIPVPDNFDSAELSKTIARAATLGLVSTIADNAETADPAGLRSEALTSALMQTKSRISATPETAPRDLSGAADTCPTGGEIPQLSYVGYREKGQQLRALVSDLGRVDRGEIRKSADFFLSLGFGAEALEALSLAPDPDPYRRAIAEYLDGAPSSANPFRTVHLKCDLETALWAFLFLHDTADFDGIDLASLISRFQTWPLAVRKITGATLNSALIDRDRFDLARIVIRLSAGASGDLEIAKLEASQGNIDAALDQLEPAKDGDQRPENIVMRLRLRLDSGLAVRQEDVDIARSMLREYEGLPVGQQLRDIVIEAYVLGNNLDEAIKVAGLSRTDLSQGNVLFSHVLRYLPAEDFAWAALSFWQGYESAYSTEVNKDLRAAMDALGLGPSKAEPPLPRRLSDQLAGLMAEQAQPAIQFSDDISVSRATDILSDVNQSISDIEMRLDSLRDGS